MASGDGRLTQVQLFDCWLAPFGHRNLAGAKCGL